MNFISFLMGLFEEGLIENLTNLIDLIFCFQRDTVINLYRIRSTSTKQWKIQISRLNKQSNLKFSTIYKTNKLCSSKTRK